MVRESHTSSSLWIRYILPPQASSFKGLYRRGDVTALLSVERPEWTGDDMINTESTGCALTLLVRTPLY